MSGLDGHLEAGVAVDTARSAAGATHHTGSAGTTVTTAAARTIHATVPAAWCTMRMM